jgi:hypothetical protein
MQKWNHGIAGLLILTMLCAGCAPQTQKSPEEEQEEELTTETETYDPLAGYTESMSPERFGADYSFEVTGHVEKEDPPEPYCNTNEDGSLRLYLMEQDGTPYGIEGAIYEHDMFDMQTYLKSVPGDSEYTGSGSCTKMYIFTPKKAGETEIVTLSSYYGDDDPVYEGTIYSITVDDDLRCSMNWYAGVAENENLEVFQK